MRTNFLLIILFPIFAIDSHAQHAGHGDIPPKASPTQNAKTQERVETALKEETRVKVNVSPAEQKKIGLQTAKADISPLKVTIRTIGSVSADQSREAHVHTRLNGWIEKIFVDAIGRSVKKDEPLFELYSPDLLATQEEYLAAQRGGDMAREIARAALERLRSWNVPEREIQRLIETRKTKRTMTFNSPVTGYVVNKNAIQGMYITPEIDLYHIADLDRVWIIVTLYESDINSVNIGDIAEVKLPYDETKAFQAPISYIYPELDVETRSSRARIELENQAQTLKPGMFVNVEITKDIGESIVVPEDSVIDTGVRRIVFVKKSGTEFEPREIKTGPRVDGKISVVSGLQAGTEVVVNAHFLLDAESKVQAAIEKNGSTSQGHDSHGDQK